MRDAVLANSGRVTDEWFMLPAIRPPRIRGVVLLGILAVFRMVHAHAAHPPPAFEWHRTVATGDLALGGHFLAASPSGGFYLAGHAGSVGMSLGETRLDGSHWGGPFLAKFTDAGEFQWVQPLGTNAAGLGSNAYPSALQVDPAGAVWLAGADWANGSMSAGFLARASATGQTQWRTTLPEFLPTDLVLGSGGGAGAWVLVEPPTLTTRTEATVLRVDPQGAVSNLFPRPFPNPKLAAHGNGVVVAGTFYAPWSLPDGPELQPDVGWSGYVVAYDATGRRQWHVTPRGSGSFNVQVLTTDGVGNFYIAGSISGLAVLGDQVLSAPDETASYAAKIDGEGRVVWARKIGAWMLFDKLLATADGQVRLVQLFEFGTRIGEWAATPKAKTDWLVIALNAQGQVDWLQQAAAFQGGILSAAALDNSGGLLLAGNLWDTALFEGDRVSVGRGEWVVARVGTLPQTPAAPGFLREPPAAVDVVPGTFQLALEAEVSGPPPLSFQWLQDGHALPGEQRYRRVISPVGTTDGGDYQLVVSNPWGSVTSAVSRVNLLTPCPPVSLANPEFWAVTWSTQHVDLTVHSVLRQALPGSVVRFEVFETEGTAVHWSPEVIQVPEGAEPVPVATRIAGLPPGQGIRGRISVDAPGATCVPSSASISFEFLTPTNQFTRFPLSFGIARPLDVWADFDGDGQVDSVDQPLASPSSGRVSVVEGLDQTILTQPEFLRSGIVALDFDGDGRPDVVQWERQGTNDNENILVAYRNQPDGTLNPPTISSPALASGRLVPIDVDHDGFEDLLIVGRTNTLAGKPAAWWQRSQGDGRFKLATMVPFPALEPTVVETADIDGDGWMDLLIAETNSTAGVTRVLRNTHQNGFTVMDGAWGGLQVRSAAWADFTGDGRLDLVLAGAGGEGVPMVRIYSDGGGRGFVEVGDGFPTNVVAVVAAGDLDGDGRADLVVMSAEPRIYYNTGNGHFRPANETLPLTPTPEFASNASRCRLIDYDGDGDLDLLWVNGASGYELGINHGEDTEIPRFRVSSDGPGTEGVGTRVRLEGGRGREYELEASTDFRQWKSVGRVLNAGRFTEIANPLEPGTAWRFLRARR